MIHTEAEIILPETLQLLRVLQHDPILDEFFLAGGTALALHIGHRLSIDLDLFSATILALDKVGSRKSEVGSRNDLGRSATSWLSIVSNLRRVALFSEEPFDTNELETHLAHNEAYETKSPRPNPMIPLKGLTYFEDIDFEIEKPILKRKVTFRQVKNRLIEAGKSPAKIFQPE